MFPIVGKRTLTCRQRTSSRSDCLLDNCPSLSVFSVSPCSLSIAETSQLGGLSLRIGSAVQTTTATVDTQKPIGFSSGCARSSIDRDRPRLPARYEGKCMSPWDRPTHEKDLLSFKSLDLAGYMFHRENTPYCFYRPRIANVCCSSPSIRQQPGSSLNFPELS